MKTSANLYKRYRFPPEIIQYTVWLYYRFNLSHRDIEDLLAQRGIDVSYESIRLWCNKFGKQYARHLKRQHNGYGDTLYLDEVFLNIKGRQCYLWRAVDQDGEIVDVYLQTRRDVKAARRFLERCIHNHNGKIRQMVSDKLKSYRVAHQSMRLDISHNTDRYANNRAEVSHQPTRVRERVMRKFKSLVHAQRFVNIHAAIYNLFNLGRHLIKAEHYRILRHNAFTSWKSVVEI